MIDPFPMLAEVCCLAVVGACLLGVGLFHMGHPHSALQESRQTAGFQSLLHSMKSAVPWEQLHTLQSFSEDFVSTASVTANDWIAQLPVAEGLEWAHHAKEKLCTWMMDSFYRWLLASFMKLCKFVAL